MLKKSIEYFKHCDTFNKSSKQDRNIPKDTINRTFNDQKSISPFFSTYTSTWPAASRLVKRGKITNLVATSDKPSWIPGQLERRNVVKGDLGGPLPKKMVILLRRNFSRGPTTASRLKNFSHFFYATLSSTWYHHGSPIGFSLLSEEATRCVPPDLCHVILRPLSIWLTFAQASS